MNESRLDYPFTQRVRTAFVRERWTLSLLLAALVVRLHWNLVVHPLGKYVYSDMGGYAAKADSLLDHPWETHAYDVFFPYGTSWLVAASRWSFGRENYEAISITYALFGAISVVLAYLVARRVFSHKMVAPLVGLILVFYYPQISLGGYILSEPPFVALLLGAQWFILRLVDEGRNRDAVAAGLCVAVGMVFRPQLLLSCVFFGLYWLVARRHMPAVRFKALLLSAVPIVLVLGLSSYRIYRHTGHFGLIAENTSVNLLLGRCHAARVEASRDPDRHKGVSFTPPAFRQLLIADKRKVDRWIRLNPALGPTIRHSGYVGNSRTHAKIIRRCVEKTGLWGQVKYAFTNVVLLWEYNTAWPDSSRKQWRGIAKWWQKRNKYLFAIPALLGLLYLLRPSRALRPGLVALNVLVLIVVSAVFFGGGRHRSTYDPLIIILAVEVYASVAVWLWIRVRDRVARGRKR